MCNRVLNVLGLKLEGGMLALGRFIPPDYVIADLKHLSRDHKFLE